MPNAHGNNRGGARPGAGRKKKPLADAKLDGTDATILKPPNVPDNTQMPPIKDYLKDEQRMGELYAEEVYTEVWNWINKYNCIELVNPQLIEQYAMCTARWIQLEKLISSYGFLSKREHVNSYMVAPFVTVSHAYLKHANQLWFQIYQIIVQNNSTKFYDSAEDEMEKILRGI